MDPFFSAAVVVLGVVALSGFLVRLDRRNRARLGVTTTAISGQERLWLPGPPVLVLNAAEAALLDLPNAAPKRLRRREQSVSMRTRWGPASWGQRVAVTVEERPGGVGVLVTSKSLIPTTRIDYGVNAANTRDVAAFLTEHVGVK